MKGILKAISGQSYGLFDKKDNLLKKFVVLNPNKRKLIDPLQRSVVDLDDIVEIINSKSKKS